LLRTYAKPQLRRQFRQDATSGDDSRRLLSGF